MKLRNKILILTIGLIVFIGIILLVFVQSTLTQRLSAELKEEGVFITTQFAKNSINNVLTEDYLNLKIAVDDYHQGYQEIEYIYILDKHREPLVHSFEKGFPVELKTVNPVKAGHEFSIQYILIGEIEVYDIAVPLLTGQIGFLHIGFSKTRLSNAVTNTVQLIIAIITISLFLGIIIAGYFSSVITKPIDELTNATIELSEGNLDRKVKVKSKDEIGMLGITFNKMVSDLQRTTVSLNYVGSIIDTMGNALFVLSNNGEIRKVNLAAQKTMGYSAEELIGQPIKNFVVNNTGGNGLNHLDLVTHQQETVKNIALNMLAKNGLQIPVLFSSTPMPASHGEKKGIVCVAQDITNLKQAEKERNKLEAQLLHAQKMEAIGTLAGGIAHDFNNLLMGIQGYASLMLLECDSNHPHSAKLKSIEQQAQRGAELTMQLLGFARGGKYQVMPTDINDLIISTSDMFGRTNKEITVHTCLQENIWTAEVDQGQIEQVLLNLYVNASQAMPNGGNLFIETQNVTLNEDYVKPFAIKYGNYLKLTITDDGIGISKENQERIFEPFFTTKEMGRGSGLGLATVYGIIKNHDGIINVYSEEGEGTTFSIYLHSLEKKVEIEKSNVNDEILTGSETILFIDDEEIIIDVGESMLTRLGYKVYKAKSGREGLEIFKKKRDEIDLIILDLVMPGINGGETFDQIKEINPGIRVLLASGYSANGRAKEIINRGANGFIQKPFNVAELSQKLRTILIS